MAELNASTCVNNCRGQKTEHNRAGSSAFSIRIRAASVVGRHVKNAGPHHN
jgi:hypothetical protein